jgi:uncharacterized protein YjbI with pentapeptide repeats
MRALLPLALIALLLFPVSIARAQASSYLEKIDYTLTNQSNGDFHNQDLEGSSFAGAVARGANFAGAKLQGAILTQGSFAGADFQGADLSDALMDRADFVGTNLADANLSGVIASGSSFSDARIDGADFSDALLDREDQRSLCRRAKGRNSATGADTRTSLNCS